MEQVHACNGSCYLAIIQVLDTSSTNFFDASANSKDEGQIYTASMAVGVGSVGLVCTGPIFQPNSVAAFTRAPLRAL